MVSAMAETGLQEAWNEMQALVAWRRDNGFWDRGRAGQARYWFDQEVRNALLAQLETGPARAELERLGRAVAEGRMSPGAAAGEMLEALSGARKAV